MDQLWAWDTECELTEFRDHQSDVGAWRGSEFWVGFFATESSRDPHRCVWQGSQVRELGAEEWRSIAAPGARLCARHGAIWGGWQYARSDRGQGEDLRVGLSDAERGVGPISARERNRGDAKALRDRRRTDRRVWTAVLVGASVERGGGTVRAGFACLLGSAFGA